MWGFRRDAYSGGQEFPERLSEYCLLKNDSPYTEDTYKLRYLYEYNKSFNTKMEATGSSETLVPT